jgi:hypothetical protein
MRANRYGHSDFTNTWFNEEFMQLNSVILCMINMYMIVDIKV